MPLTTLIPEPVRTWLRLVTYMRRGASDARMWPQSPSAGTATVLPNPLETYFDAHTTGRGIYKWRHYFDIYHRHFQKFRDRPVHVLEVGIFSGGSLEMWRHYFGPQARLTAVDIDPACRQYAGDGVDVHIGDQGDPAFWADLLKKVPPIDVVIEDGSHWPAHQVVTLRALLPHLRPGGVYLCEDIHNDYNSFHAYLYGLSHSLHVWMHGRSGEDESPASPIQAQIASIHHYPYVAVIERTEGQRAALHADKRGTEWIRGTDWD
jgi:SAM-dependent methyltransferase